jgi:iron complex outermembrane recepter protein
MPVMRTKGGSFPHGRRTNFDRLSPQFVVVKTKVMLKSFFVAAMGVCSVVGYAQVALSGRVVDASKEALAGATVQLVEANQNVIADADGKFLFQNVKVGTHTLRVRFVDFEVWSKTILIEKDFSVEVELSVSNILNEEVIVLGTRANEKSPFVFSQVEKPTIQQQNFGQDMPMLLNWTPSVVTTSDAGAGVGYTGIRIRGSDATRINVTINGVPFNDSESQSVYWVNVPDIATSTQSIQIQRGVGTSSNGPGAFGASINLQTNSLKAKPYAELINSFGSFGTMRHTIGAGTGKMENKFSFDVRGSSIKSDGFIDRASSDLKSYYLSGGYYGDKTIVKAIVFGGREITYQSWYGVPESRLKGNVDAMMETAYTEGWTDAEINNLLNSNSRTFNHYTYENQVDNYTQNHYQLHLSHKFTNDLTGSISLHATKGKGYYEEFRTDASFENYGIDDAIIGADTISSSDLVRRRWLDNIFYGATYSLQLEKDKWNSVLGGGWNRYDGDHFGEIIWAKVSTNIPKDFQYYFNNGVKTDFNVYWKNNYQVLPRLNAFLDLQLRTIAYDASGVENTLSQFHVHQQYAFSNPKAGLTVELNANTQAFASFAVANREPVRDDFVDAVAGKIPKPETLLDWEVGVRGKRKKLAFNVNGYFMDYKNQLVLTGAVNDVGSSIRTNVEKSYRAGLELEGEYSITPKITWAANLTLSQNKIKNFTEVLYNYGDNFDQYDEVVNNHGSPDISFSPNVIAGSNLSYKIFKGFEATWLGKYVGSQYLDNTSNSARQLDAYLVNDVRLSYSVSVKGVCDISLSLLVNNILDVEYSSNGYTYGFLGGATTYRQNYFYPQAGRNFMAMVGVRF